MLLVFVVCFLETHKQHRSLSRVDAMVLLVSGFWNLQWNIAGICERDSYGMDCFFLSGKDVALEGQLRFMYHPELDELCIAFIAVDFELYLDLWMKNIYRVFNKVRDISFGRYSALMGVNIYW